MGDVDGAAPASTALSPQALLEMARGGLRIFTSCAWSFDDIGGLEPIEVLRYAARAIELAGPAGAELETALLARLADAKSNDPTIGTGRDVYLTSAKPRIAQLARLAGSVAAARAISAADPRARAASHALGVDATADAITIHQHRTGERQSFSVFVSGLPPANGASANGDATWSPSMIAAQLAAPPLDVSLSEMTELQRAVVEDGIRHRLIVTAFGENPPFLERGNTADVLSHALIQTITALGHAPTADLTSRVHALLDLMELERLHIPFDAQTRFHDGFLAGGTALSSELAAVAWRLGFAKVEPANN
jgi:hypothetical protein